jgi:hypothetical protein
MHATRCTCVNKACWLLACLEERLDIPAERSCLGGGPVVVRVCSNAKSEKSILASGKVVYVVGLALWAW